VDQVKEAQMSAKTVIPNLPSMTPAKAARAWSLWLEDNWPPEGFSDSLSGLNIGVDLAISEYRLNFGKPAEEASRKNLATWTATFQASFNQL